MAEEDIQLLEDVVVTAPSPCRIKREKQTDNNEARRGSPLAASLRQINNSILVETDCTSLQQKVKTALNGIKEDITSGSAEITRKLDEILPLLSLPLNPAKIPKWLKKFVIGRIMPDLDATISLILRVVEITTALTELINTINQVLPRLEACAVSTRAMVRSDIENEIEKTLLDIKASIENAIAEAICDGINAAGITADDIDDILTGVASVTLLVDSIDAFKQSVDVVLNDNISRVGSSQALIEDITGIPPVVDTTTVDTFVETSTGDDYNNYKTQVQGILDLPEPVNTVLPIITGVAAVGDTLVCSNGVWTANGIVTNFVLSFQWMRQGQEISGANTYQYIPVVDDIDYPLYCKVIAENQTNIEEVITVSTAPVVFAMAGANTPVITGSAINGATLTCNTGTWPFTPTAITYEWVRVVSSPSSNVRVQSSSSNNLYLVKSADIGSSIKCRVVAQSFRYTLAIDTANTAVVS
jgi:hypothetical protein